MPVPIWRTESRRSAECRDALLFQQWRERDSFPSLHLHPYNIRELFGGWEVAFKFTGQLRLQFMNRDTDGVGFGAEGILHLDVVLFRAEDDADGGLVVGAAPLKCGRKPPGPSVPQ
jgi:hypothetical protein